MPRLAVTPIGLRRGEQVLLVAALAAATVAAWYGTVATAADMAGMASMPQMGGGWPAPRLVSVAVMWVVMMVAMMLPSAAPMLFTYAAVTRRQHSPLHATALWSVFVAGYLLVWAAFGLAATAAQWSLSEADLISGGVLGSTLGGAALAAAGLYQLTPFKQACLGRCRSPLGFLLHDWREGGPGALVMGLRHGLSCTGCCLGLMIVLFSVGVMNLAWITMLTAVVAAEKILPGGHRIALAGGVAFTAFGAWLLLGGTLPGLVPAR